MSRRPVARRYVDDIAEALFAPLLASPREERSWHVVGWDAEQGLSLTIARGDALLLIELESRDETRDGYARTDRFNVCARRAFEAGTPLTRRDRAFVDRVVAMIRRRETSLPDVERSVGGSRAAVRPIRVERVLVPEGRGHYYINPYVGCAIGCPFCFIAERADLSRRLEGLPRVPWGRWVDVKVNAAEVLAEEVRRLPPGIVRFSPLLTDPYQPVERHHRVTRQCLEVLLEAGFRPVILTRAARVIEDLPLLRRFAHAAVGFSIPTDDDRCRRIFEPGGDPVEERIAALAACRAAGLTTFAVLQPLLPMDAERLVAEVAPLVRAVRFDRMHGLAAVRHLYADNGLEHAMTEPFFADLERRLRAGFTARGVRIDELDDLAHLVR